MEMEINPIDRIFLIILSFLAFRAGLDILKRRLAGRPISEDEATATFKCPTCGSTLIFGMEKCDSCGIAIDQDEAYESAVIRFFINRAISRANTLFTLSPAGVIMTGLSVFLHFSGSRFHVLLVLISTVFCTALVTAWSYRHADVQVAHPGFLAVQKRMRRHLHFWLAAASVQIILLILRW
jgi:hypothetical protein